MPDDAPFFNDELLTTLRDTFGFAAFRPGQEQALGAILAGKHTLVVMPTGSGKSLIYQLAALRLPGATLVISPLIALMKDQVDSLGARGVAAAFINSSLDNQQQQQRLDALAASEFKIVYVAPERLRSTAFVTALKAARVSLLAVDEAHCLSHWGHDFRPDYLYIAEIRSGLGELPTVALTATATPQVQDDIVRLLGLPDVERIVTGFNRPNLTFEVRYTSGPEAKLAALRELLLSADGAGIVYAGTRRNTEEVAEFARRVCGVEALYYHAGLEAEARARAQDAFMAGDVPLMVATNAFGMGVDRPDVRFVLHYTLPGSLEAYYQEAGRAGRDELPARCTLLYAPQDQALQEWFIENDSPSPQEVRSLYAAVQAQVSGGVAAVTCADLARATSLYEVKVRVGLAQLEEAGALRRLGDAGARMYVTLDALDPTRLRAVAGRAEARRAHKRRQLAGMAAYAEMNACRRRAILAHFGDKGEAEAELCCDNCLARAQAEEDEATRAGKQAGGTAGELDPAGRAALVVLDTVRRLKWGVGRRKLAQILKGSRSKEISRFDYDKSIYYGRYAEMQLNELSGWVDQLIEAGYLKVVGGEHPVVRLTPRGEQAIKTRQAVPLRLSRPIRPQITARKQAERQAGGTLALSGQLLASGLSPAQIAAVPQARPSSAAGRIQRIVQLGNERSLERLPELIAALGDPDGNVRRLAASALGKIKARGAVEPIMALLAQETKPQVRHYAVKALGQIGDVRARSLLEKISQDEAERDYTRTSARLALKRLRVPGHRAH
ncbi:MAG: RecQ family ATP-dependent DNA helicase [Thermoflexales bacterium]|nr:RecQ family ATP-dependent DNA helicase [Thermoflexales bacterium]